MEILIFNHPPDKMHALSLIFILSLLLGCTETKETHMQQQELLTQIKTPHAPVIIDVRSDSEFQSGHIGNALHIPFWQAFTTDKLDNFKKNQLLVLYCQHGPRAGVAKLAFRLAGFENIHYLQGHMAGWKKSGLTTITQYESN